MEYKYYLSQLNEKERTLYTYIYNNISIFANSFIVKDSVNIIQKVIKAIMLDNPELFWFEGKWKAGYKKSYIVVFPEYKQQIAYSTLAAHIESVIKEVLKQRSKSDVVNIKKIYDWMLSNVQYGYSKNDQTIEGALVDKKALCKGIAKAFQLFMNKLGIPSFLIEGTIDGQTHHIWNVVFTKGHFYHVDVTMGYPRFSVLFDEKSRNKHYPCFMVSDKTIEKTHKIYLNQILQCTDDFDLDSFLVEQLEVPPRFMRYGSFKYLDRGSTCTVLKIVSENSQYVLKVIDTEKSKFKYNMAFAELQKLQLLFECDGIVPLIDSMVSKRKDKIYMLFQYCKPLIIRRKENDFDTTQNTLKLGIDILEVLIKLREKGIFHLDIQPKNIYFDNNNKAILGDFSCSSYENELAKLKPGVGTLAFMAPEVYQYGIYGEKSEIYSLGIILYALLNNAKLPFLEEHDTQTALKLRLEGAELPKPHKCSDEIWQCIKKMCEYDHLKRFSTYEDALNTIAKLLNTEKT